MADPAPDGAATAPEDTSTEAPASNGDGFSTDQQAAVKAADNPDQVRAILSEASRRARQAEAEAKAARQELQGLQDQGKSEAEKLASRAQRAEARVAELERSLLISGVASKYDLHPELVPRLRGDTEEELEADAKALAKQFPRQQEAPPPDLGAGPRPPATGGGSKAFSDSIRRRAQGRR
jgi:hypothetical protein